MSGAICASHQRCRMYGPLANEFAPTGLCLLQISNPPQSSWIEQVGQHIRQYPALLETGRFHGGVYARLQRYLTAAAVCIGDAQRNFLRRRDALFNTQDVKALVALEPQRLGGIGA